MNFKALHLGWGTEFADTIGAPESQLLSPGFWPNIYRSAIENNNKIKSILFPHFPICFSTFNFFYIFDNFSRVRSEAVGKHRGEPTQGKQY